MQWREDLFHMQQSGSTDTTRSVLYNEHTNSVLLQPSHAPRMDSKRGHTCTILFTGAATVPPKSPVSTS